jgi:hypothetical protein
MIVEGPKKELIMEEYVSLALLEIHDDMKSRLFDEGYMNTSTYDLFLKAVMPHIYLSSAIACANQSDSEFENDVVIASRQNK